MLERVSSVGGKGALDAGICVMASWQIRRKKKDGGIQREVGGPKSLSEAAYLKIYQDSWGDDSMVTIYGRHIYRTGTAWHDICLGCPKVQGYHFMAFLLRLVNRIGFIALANLKNI
jgi:hypothetical protein